MTSEVQLGVKVDWVTFVWRGGRPHGKVTLVRQKIEELLGPSTVCERGINLYRRSVKWESGAVLAWSPDVDHFCLVLNGASCSLVGDRIYQLIKWAEGCGATSSRLDGAVDDPSRAVFDLAKIEEAARAGDFVGFKHVETRCPMRRVAGGGLEPSGRSITFGKRGGDGRQVQFYDKGLESGGEVDVVRLEVRWSGDMARLMFSALASSPTEQRFWEKLRNHIGGAIDFRERRKHRHIDRMKVLPWWSRILQLLGRARVMLSKVTAPLQRTIEYFRDNWGRPLAKAIQIIDAAGHDGRAVILGLIEREMGRAEAWRPGAVDLGIDVERLLCGKRR